MNRYSPPWFDTVCATVALGTALFFFAVWPVLGLSTFIFAASSAALDWILVWLGRGALDLFNRAVFLYYGAICFLVIFSLMIFRILRAVVICSLAGMVLMRRRRNDDRDRED